MKKIRTLFVAIAILIGTGMISAFQPGPTLTNYIVQLDITGTDYFNYDTGEYMNCTFFHGGTSYIDNTPIQLSPKRYFFHDTVSSGLDSVHIYGIAFDDTIQYYISKGTDKTAQSKVYVKTSWQ